MDLKAAILDYADKLDRRATIYEEVAADTASEAYITQRASVMALRFRNIASDLRQLTTESEN